MTLLISLYLLLVVVLPLALGTAVGYLKLPRSVCCPVCSGETIRIVDRWLDLLSRLLRDWSVHRRWCLMCEWEGVCRVRLELPQRHAGPTAAGARRAAAGVSGRDPGATVQESFDLRDLRIEGRNWRVVLEYWGGSDGWFGRILYIGPSGRCWKDPSDLLRGATPREVLGQALALPEGALVGRVRALISDRAG